MQFVNVNSATLLVDQFGHAAMELPTAIGDAKLRVSLDALPSPEGVTMGLYCLLVDGQYTLEYATRMGFAVPFGPEFDCYEALLNIVNSSYFKQNIENPMSRKLMQIQKYRQH